MNTELETAIRGSAARFEADDVAGRLHVRLLRGGALETGEHGTARAPSEVIVSVAAVHTRCRQ